MASRMDGASSSSHSTLALDSANARNASAHPSTVPERAEQGARVLFLLQSSRVRLVPRHGLVPRAHRRSIRPGDARRLRLFLSRGARERLVVVVAHDASMNGMIIGTRVVLTWVR